MRLRLLGCFYYIPTTDQTYQCISTNFAAFFVIYNKQVGYSRKAQTQRNVLPQMKWSVLNLITEGEIMSRKFWIRTSFCVTETG